MERRTCGTRPKGDRRAITARVPRDQWEVFEERRKAEGYDSLSDYVNALLARDNGLPLPAYVHRAPRMSGQGTLPLARTGHDEDLAMAG